MGGRVVDRSVGRSVGQAAGVKRGRVPSCGGQGSKANLSHPSLCVFLGTRGQRRPTSGIVVYKNAGHARVVL